MRLVTGVVMALVAVLWVSDPSFAQPAAPVTAATQAREAQDEPPTAAAPRPASESQPWTGRMDREPPASAREAARSWYGWQTLLVDGLLVGSAVLTAVATDDLNLGLWLAVGTFTIGSPIVHFAHRNLAPGLSSLAMRAAPAGLMALALSINAEREGVVFGWLAILGAVTAMAVDAAVFAWDEPPHGERPHAWLTPWLDPQHGRIGLAYASTF